MPAAQRVAMSSSTNDSRFDGLKRDLREARSKLEAQRELQMQRNEDVPASLAESQNMTMSNTTRQLMQLGAEILGERNRLAQRYDDLAREREELSFDAVDEMLHDTGGLGDDKVHTLSKIESLELSLVQEKQTLAEIQAALQEAKDQRLVQQQLTKVRKHHKFLEGMAGQLSATALQEMEEKRKWEGEWSHKLETFKKQHLELQQGLEKKQQAETRRLQQDFQRKIKKLNDDVALMKSKGRAPSPRALMKVQDENVEQVVLLFQQHAQERLYLTEKISKQEDLLMKSRSQSLQHLFMESQTKSENLYRRFNPKQVAMPKPARMIMDDTGRGKLHRDAANGIPPGPPPIVVTAPPSRMSLHSSRASIRRLPSPRVEISAEGGDMLFSANFFLPGEMEREEEEELNLSLPPTLPPSRMSRTVSFDGRETPGIDGGRRVGNNAEHLSSAMLDSRSKVSRFAEPQDDVVSHNHSFGDQEAHRRQNTTRASSRRPVYAGAHGRLGTDESKDLAPLPMPGTEETGWKPIETKHMRGTNAGGIRPAFMSQLVTSQYRDSSAKISSGTITHMGGDQRLQKASGAAYRVPIEKLGLSMGRTLPNVRSRTREEREERKRKSGHSILDALNPKSPDWGTVTTGAKSRSGMASYPGRVDELTQQAQGASKVAQSKEGVRESAEAWPPIVHSRTEDPVVSEKFSQLEAWVEEKIRFILGEQGAPAAADKAGRPASNGGDGQAAGPRMHTTSSTPQQVSSGVDKSKANGALPGLARTESASAIAGKSDSSIGKLLTRLKTTMASDEKLAEPPDKRKHRPTAIDSDVEPMSGMRNENHMARKADTAKIRQLQAGAEVEQSYDDLEMRGEDRSEPWAISGSTQERRGRLGNIDTSGALHSMTPKTPKRVGFAVDDEENVGNEGNHDAFRPETGYSQQSHAHDRPETGMSSAFDPSSRPVTGLDDPVRAGTSVAKPAVDDDTQDAGGDNAGGESQMSKASFFPLVRHNKVAEAEDMLAAGFEVDTRDEHGNTMLIVSCQNGHKRLAKLALKYGASPDTTNHQGNTALHYAIAYGYSAMSKYLISHGADDTVMNLHGQTPYEMKK